MVNIKMNINDGWFDGGLNSIAIVVDTIHRFTVNIMNGINVFGTGVSYRYITVNLQHELTTIMIELYALFIYF